MLVELNKKNGWEIPIHVDAVSTVVVVVVMMTMIMMKMMMINDHDHDGHVFCPVLDGWIFNRPVVGLLPHLLPLIWYGTFDCHCELNSTTTSTTTLLL